MVLVTDFARGVSVPRPLPMPPSPCARWVRVGSSLAASLLLSLVWLASFTRLFLRYNQWVLDPHHFGNLDPESASKWIRIRIYLQMTSRNDWNMNLIQHFFKGLSLYLEARIWIRIRIKVISWIRIRINLQMTSQNVWNMNLF